VEIFYYIYYVINEISMPKYKFRFNKKPIHLIIPHKEGEILSLIALMGVTELKKSGYYTEDELYQIGNIPMGTLMSMFKQIV
jgi:hypothetical protein